VVSTVGQASQRTKVGAAIAILVGGLVALALGLYGREHTPTGQDIALFGFGNLIEMKVWLAIAAGGLALLQGFTALWMFGKLGLSVPRRLPWVHRGLGALAILVSLPVAYHCLWSLGFQTYTTRVLVHSLLGCLVYGAFVTKVIGLHARSTPGWLVPVAGGLLFVVLVGVVLTSAGWYINDNGLPTSNSTNY
jgi:hypothetical protein